MVTAPSLHLELRGMSVMESTMPQSGAWHNKQTLPSFV